MPLKGMPEETYVQLASLAKDRDVDVRFIEMMPIGLGKEYCGVSGQEIYNILKERFGEEKPFSYLHRIIDSSLDGDRLDYVTRDSLNSGMDSGKIDYNRIINDMQLIVDEKEVFFCVPLKAVNSVEDFIKRRYNIYKDIIYHHRVIKTDYLLEYTVRDLVKKYLQGSSDSEFHNNRVLIPFDISGLWFPLREGTTSEKSNALSQWNDSWLMTVLKQIYYTEYYRNRDIKSGTSEYILKQRLSELLRNNKCYYSLIKRSENFKVIDDAVKAVLAENREEIENLVKKTNELSSSLNSTTVSEGTTVDIKGTLDFIEEILSNTTKTPKGFVLSFVSRRYKAIQIDSFKSFIKEIVEQIDVDPDVIVREKRLLAHKPDPIVDVPLLRLSREESLVQQIASVFHRQRFQKRQFHKCDVRLLIQDTPQNRFVFPHQMPGIQIRAGVIPRMRKIRP